MADHHIASLVWDDWNRAHIQKHGVSPSEVEDVIGGDAIAFPSYKDRLVIIGPNRDGELRVVVAGLVPGSDDVYYVFSARPASRKERHRYAAEKGDRAV